MAESPEVKEARERLDRANAALEADDSLENQEAAKVAFHAWLDVADPFALEDYEEER